MSLIFEQTTSALYYSNDGRLRLESVTHPDDEGIALPRTIHVLKLDGREVFATFDRVKADAYIAGYDLGISQEEEEGRLRRAAEQLGIDL